MADLMHEQLQDFVSRQRWFGGKGREFVIADLQHLALGLTVVTVQYAAGDVELYQVPMSVYDSPHDELSHAVIGFWDEQWHYDAVHDRAVTHRWLDAIAHQQSNESLVAHRVQGHEFDLEAHSTLFGGEQSNSSLAFGEDSILKVFRRLTPGPNPDIEIHRALTAAASTHVAQLYGWLEAGDLQLGLLQQFFRTATEGWELALASVRNLFAEEDLHPDEVGGDFASEAERLGVAVAEVHATMREAMPTGIVSGKEVASRMSQRLHEAAAQIPELAEHVEHLASIYAALSVADVPVQRIHADLHLGQTLRTSLGWKLVDFEGEPARPLHERMLPDSPWRDVAGMLRSFDYAARVVQKDVSVSPELAGQLHHRADEWVARNREAFLTGYQDTGGQFTEADLDLIRAYEADKAVYETFYEARNRPGWIGIPLNAIHNLLEG